MNWGHLRTILWLRWRLSRNQMDRGGTLNVVLTMIFLVVGMVASVAGAVGGFFGGYLGLASAPPWAILLTWDVIAAVFLFFWMTGLLVEVQRSESIDLTKMLHLPVSLAQIFVINFVASHLSPILLLAFPGMLGLTAGLIASRGPVFLWLVPSLLGFVFMVTAWTYCLRGWLATIMINKRRRRTIVVGLTMAFVLLAQLPNLYLNVLRQPNRHRPAASDQGTPPASRPPKVSPEKLWLSPTMLAAHRWVPLLWLPGGAQGLANGQRGHVIAGALGALALGGLGLLRAYRTTVRFYRGDSRGRVQSAAQGLGQTSRPDIQTMVAEATAEPMASKARGSPAEGAMPSTADRGRHKRFLEWSLPWVSNQSAALALATFRSMVRAPETKMGLIMPFVMVLIFGSMLLRRTEPKWTMLEPFVPTGLAFLILFGMLQIALNQFGSDRDGFRALILLPAKRKRLLLAKNLALLGLSLGIQLVMALVLACFQRFAASWIAAGVFQFLTGFLLLSMIGNWASIFAPYRVAHGSLKRNRIGKSIFLVVLVVHLLYPLAMIPIFLPPAVELLLKTAGIHTGLPVSLLVSALMLGLTWLIYQSVLDVQGRQLQHREKDILRVVTQEME